MRALVALLPSPHHVDSCKLLLLVDTKVSKQGGMSAFLMRDETT